MVNTKRIHDRMAQLDITMNDLAIYMNKSVKSLSQLIENQKMMVLYEAYMIADYLQIDDDEICEFFFYSDHDSVCVEEPVTV